MPSPPPGSVLDRDSNTLHLSPIFLWFVKDFEPYGGVAKFVTSYLPAEEAQYVSQHKPTLNYFSYSCVPLKIKERLVPFPEI